MLGLPLRLGTGVAAHCLGNIPSPLHIRSCVFCVCVSPKKKNTSSQLNHFNLNLSLFFQSHLFCLYFYNQGKAKSAHNFRWSSQKRPKTPFPSYSIFLRQVSSPTPFLSSTGSKESNSSPCCADLSGLTESILFLLGKH